MESGNHTAAALGEGSYARRLEGLSRFRDLNSTFDSLQRLDSIYREYREAADRVGTCAVREAVARAKSRTERLAHDSRLSSDKRQEKQEITQWCRVWLEVPDLFFDWVEMRKQSPEFQKLFAHRNGWHLKQT